MDWRIAQLAKVRYYRPDYKEPNIENIRFFGRTKKEVKQILRKYLQYEKENVLYAILSTNWYKGTKVIKLIFKGNRVEEKYLNFISNFHQFKFNSLIELFLL